jgi:hypothetical protein
MMEFKSKNIYVGCEVPAVVVIKEFYLLGYNIMQFGESQQTFYWNMWPPSSGSKNKLAMFHAGFFLGLFLHPEYGGVMFLHNISRLPADYMVLYPRQQSSLVR